jgi:hypothetical protein
VALLVHREADRGGTPTAGHEDIRLHLPEAVSGARSAAMNARHPGWCQKCRSKYAVSTRIKYTQTWGWVHEKCHQHPLARKPVIT